MKKIIISILSVGLISLFVYGCNSSSTKSSSKILEKGVYLGKNATKEIIEVSEDTTWTIKSDLKDSSFNTVSVSDTGKKIDEYPVVKLTIEDTKGDIESYFGTREGRNFLVARENDNVYFIAISDENREEIEKNIVKEKEDKIAYLKRVSKYSFEKR